MRIDSSSLNRELLISMGMIAEDDGTCGCTNCASPLVDTARSARDAVGADCCYARAVMLWLGAIQLLQQSSFSLLIREILDNIDLPAPICISSRAGMGFKP